MSLPVDLRCSGCDASAAATLRREFHGIHGGNSGFGHWQLHLDAPGEWVAFDPFTNVTYCPACWAEIARPEGDADVPST